MLELDVKGLEKNLCVKNGTKGAEMQVELGLSDREKDIVKAGGKLAAIKAKQVKESLRRFHLKSATSRRASEAVPKKTVEQNLKAFDLGKKSVPGSLCALVSCRRLP
jgi:hypothetical protein